MNAEVVRFSRFRSYKVLCSIMNALLLFAVIVGMGSISATAQALKVVQVNPPNVGAVPSYAFGVNKSNIVVGEYVDASNAIGGFAYLGGKNYKRSRRPDLTISPASLGSATLMLLSATFWALITSSTVFFWKMAVRNSCNTILPRVRPPLLSSASTQPAISQELPAREVPIRVS